MNRVVRRFVGSMRAACCLLAISGMLIASCGVSQRQRALTTALGAVDAARDGFVEWDEQKQTKIVDEASSLEKGQADLVAYREAREEVVALFELVYQGLAAAALNRHDITLEEALARAGRLHEALRKLGFP